MPLESPRPIEAGQGIGSSLAKVLGLSLAVILERVVWDNTLESILGKINQVTIV